MLGDCVASIGASDPLYESVVPAAPTKYAVPSFSLRPPGVLLGMIWVGTVVPIGSPLPHVARHIHYTEWTLTLGKMTDWRCRRKTIILIIHSIIFIFSQQAVVLEHFEGLLSGAIQQGWVWIRMTPWVSVGLGATRRVFPLGFCREARPSEFTVLARHLPVHAIDWMIFQVRLLSDTIVTPEINIRFARDAEVYFRREGPAFAFVDATLIRSSRHLRSVYTVWV